MRKAMLVLVFCSCLAMMCPKTAACDQFPGCSSCSRGKCKTHVAADRQLTAQEKEKMNAAVRIILDPQKRAYHRAEAARVLGEKVAHRDAIEPLKRIAFSGAESPRLRYWAVTALSQIADKQVIPLLIDLTLDDQIGGRAKEQLFKLTRMRFPPGFSWVEEGPPEEWWPRSKGRYREAWMKWWEQNRETFVFDRKRALIEF